jgi:hypothetical protein
VTGVSDEIPLVAKVKSTAPLQRHERVPQRVATRKPESPVAAPVAVRLSDLSRDPASNRAVQEAKELAIARCMQAQGFDYQRVPYDEQGKAEAHYEQLDPDDLDAAKAVGYRLALDIERGEAPSTDKDPNDVARERMSPEQLAQFDRALVGTTPEPHVPIADDDPNIGVVAIEGGPKVRWDRRSCVSEARRALYGDEREEQRLRLALSMARGQIARGTNADPEFRRAVDQWRDCMRGHGHRYETSSDASSALASRYHAGELTLQQLQAAEIDVATADMGCQRSSGLPAALKAARARAEETFERDNQPLMASYKRMNDDSAQAAATLLESEALQAQAPR